MPSRREPYKPQRGAGMPWYAKLQLGINPAAHAKPKRSPATPTRQTSQPSNSLTFGEQIALGTRGRLNDDSEKRLKEAADQRRKERRNSPWGHIA